MTAALFLAFFALIVAGNLWLASAFDFPDILRQPAAERFARFQANQGAIIPAYYLMGLTSILQIFMAVAMYHLTKRGRLVDLFAVTAGVLSGVFQVLGFFRWVILIPMLASAYGSNEISAEVIFFLEKFANTYLGMTVGEHLGTLFTGLWLLALGIVLVKNTAFDKKLAWLGLAAGIALIVQSYEAVNSAALSFLARHLHRAVGAVRGLGADPGHPAFPEAATTPPRSRCLGRLAAGAGGLPGQRRAGAALSGFKFKPEREIVTIDETCPPPSQCVRRLVSGGLSS